MNYSAEKLIQQAIQDVELLKYEYQVNTELDRRFADAIIKSRSDFNRMSGNLIIGLHAIVYGKEHEKKEIRYPKNWVESLKERFFTNKMKYRWPVKYKVHQITIHEFYPQFTPTLHEFEPVLTIRQVEIK
jgi:hypothetical protein